MSYTAMFTSDVHLGWKLYNMPELEADLKKIFVDMVDLAIAKKVNYFVVCGDLYDNQKPTSETVAFVTAQVKRLKQEGVIPVGLAGDHDLKYNGVSWLDINGFKHPADCNYFAGCDYLGSWDKTKEEIVRQSKEALIKQSKNINKCIHWLVLHGQVVGLYGFLAEAKKIDLKDIDLFGLFPNLKGVILGDLHNPTSETFTDIARNKNIPVVYCTSPGIIKSDEIGMKQGLLYFNGTSLERLPLPLPREFIKIDFKQDAVPEALNKVAEYVDKKYTNKPVFLIEYDDFTKPQLNGLSALYKVGVVKTQKSKNPGEEITLNLRSEINFKSSYSDVLRQVVKTEAGHSLGMNLLESQDIKSTLDEIKLKMLGK